MSVYWSRGIAELETYVPGEQPQDRTYIKLNTNENPYPPSPKVIEAIRNAADDRLRLYPDPDCSRLRETIARYHSLSKEEVFVGNGSDEVLAFSFAAFFDNGEPILYPDISYSFYPVYTDFFRLKALRIPLDADFSIPAASFLVPNGGIVLCNPNAPTSKILSIDEIQKILEYNHSIGKVVLVDEAYIDFGGESVAKLVPDWPNLLVVQTLSKSRSLAGLRIGFALGQRDLIEGLNRVKSSINSYTVDRLAMVGAIAAFEDEEHFRTTRAKIMETRSWVCRELRALGFAVAESGANFIFVSHPAVHASDFYAKLRESGVLVRYFRKPRIDNHIRVSIGTDAEMRVFLDTISGILTV